jgi:hypothetical protein
MFIHKSVYHCCREGEIQHRTKIPRMQESCGREVGSTTAILD